jgi:hypothetical protein
MARRLAGWMILQIVVGIWLFVSPYVLGFRGTIEATNTMVFGTVVILIGLGMSIFRENICGIEHPVKKA